MNARTVSFALALASVVIVSGCGQAPQAAQNKPVQVGVVTLTPQRVAITTELPGRTAAYRIAEVRPQVNGLILKRLFNEGSEVKAGQQLYQIDPATYRAALASAEAALTRAEAQVTTARLQAERYERLVSAHAVSQQEYDNAFAARQQAEADVAAAQAARETARINLVYTQLLSPISGRIGRSLVTEGALVTSGQDDALATVQQLDPIYVDITQSSTDLLRLQRDIASGRLQTDGDNQARVTLTLEDGSGYPEAGTLQFAEVSVDPGTGAVVLRAVFPNPKRQLLPGMFVRAHLQQGVQDEALLVPQQGVSRNPRGEPTALVVGADNRIELRVLKTERVIGDQWLVTEGLKPGEQVVVEGVQKIRPGIEVQATPVGTRTVAQASP